MQAETQRRLPSAFGQSSTDDRDARRSRGARCYSMGIGRPAAGSGDVWCHGLVWNWHWTGGWSELGAVEGGGGGLCGGRGRGRGRGSGLGGLGTGGVRSEGGQSGICRRDGGKGGTHWVTLSGIWCGPERGSETRMEERAAGAGRTAQSEMGEGRQEAARGNATRKGRQGTGGTEGVTLGRENRGSGEKSESKNEDKDAGCHFDFSPQTQTQTGASLPRTPTQPEPGLLPEFVCRTAPPITTLFTSPCRSFPLLPPYKPRSSPLLPPSYSPRLSAPVLALYLLLLPNVSHCYLPPPPCVSHDPLGLPHCKLLHRE